MAHSQAHGKYKKGNGNANSEGEPSTFHEFLGSSGGRGKGQEISGGNTPLPEFFPSATPDLGSERYANNHLDGRPFYGSRGNLKGPETSNVLTGNKRRNSDSFMASSSDKFAQRQDDSPDTPVFTKLSRRSGGQRPTLQHEEETPSGFRHMNPISASFILQSAMDDRTETNNSKLNGAIHVNLDPVMQYPSRASQLIPLGYQPPSNANNVGPSVPLQTAADEGSRTGRKGSGILSSYNANGAISGKLPSGVLVHSGKPRSGACVSEPEPPTTSQPGAESSGRQMTIFYDGQAHVFDNIHRSKADVIIGLAGSNGGSWSTISMPSTSARPATGENSFPSSKDDAGFSITRDLHALPSYSNHDFASGDK